MNSDERFVTGRPERARVRLDEAPMPEISAASTEPLRAEELRDAIGDILDICEGWTRTMSDKEALAAIKDVARKAWEGERD